MTEPPKMNQEDQLRSLGLMLETLGCVLQSSAGDAERDYLTWLSDCKHHEIPGSDANLRYWYVNVLKASGITANSEAGQ